MANEDINELRALDRELAQYFTEILLKNKELSESLADVMAAKVGWGSVNDAFATTQQALTKAATELVAIRQRVDAISTKTDQIGSESALHARLDAAQGALATKVEQIAATIAGFKVTDPSADAAANSHLAGLQTQLAAVLTRLEPVQQPLPRSEDLPADLQAFQASLIAGIETRLKPLFERPSAFRRLFGGAGGRDETPSKTRDSDSLGRQPDVERTAIAATTAGQIPGTNIIDKPQPDQVFTPPAKRTSVLKPLVGIILLMASAYGGHRLWPVEHSIGARAGSAGPVAVSSPGAQAAAGGPAAMGANDDSIEAGWRKFVVAHANSQSDSEGTKALQDACQSTDARALPQCQTFEAAFQFSTSGRLHNDGRKLILERLLNELNKSGRCEPAAVGAPTSGQTSASTANPSASTDVPITPELIASQPYKDMQFFTQITRCLLPIYSRDK